MCFDLRGPIAALCTITAVVLTYCEFRSLVERRKCRDTLCDGTWLPREMQCTVSHASQAMCRCQPNRTACITPLYRVESDLLFGICMGTPRARSSQVSASIDVLWLSSPPATSSNASFFRSQTKQYRHLPKGSRPGSREKLWRQVKSEVIKYANAWKERTWKP
nr:hypothetical protein CFP56_20688 [Quercus suber]